MRERELHNVLDVLKNAARTTYYGQGLTEEQQAALVQDFSRSRTHLGGDIPSIGVEISKYLNKALEAVEQAGVSIEEGPPKVQLLFEIGEILYIKGSWDAALGRFEKALELSEALDYAAGRAEALRQIGRLKRCRGDWEGAQESLDHALTIYRDLENTAGEADVLLNMGKIRFEQGDYEAALQSYQDALAMSENLESNQMAGDINLSLGVIRQVLGQEDEARTHFTESLARYEVIGDRRRIGQALFNIGISYGEREDWARAGVMYERALEMAREHEDAALAGMIYLRRGEMRVALSDTVMATAYGQKAQEIFDQVQDPLGRADVYILYGRIAVLEGAWDQAEELLTESARLQRQYGCRLGEAEVEEVRGHMHEHREDRPRALASYRQALTLYQELRVAGNTRRVSDAIRKLEAEI